MHVVFERPVPVAAYNGRLLFSRAVVSYDGRVGPDGADSTTFDLSDVWRDAVLIAQDTPEPCTTDTNGVSNCAPVPEFSSTQP